MYKAKFEIKCTSTLCPMGKMHLVVTLNFFYYRYYCMGTRIQVASIKYRIYHDCQAHNQNVTMLPQRLSHSCVKTIGESYVAIYL